MFKLKGLLFNEQIEKSQLESISKARPSAKTEGAVTTMMHNRVIYLYAAS